MTADAKVLLEQLDCEAFYLEHYKKLPRVEHSGEVTVLCPFHEDSKPSMRLNIESGLYKCLACGAAGNPYQYLQQLTGCSFPKAVEQVQEFVNGHPLKALKQRTVRGCYAPLPEPIDHYEVVLPWAADLFDYHPAILKYLKNERGLTEETVNTYALGYDGERITLPVWDENSELRNIRRYKPNASKGDAKMLPYKEGYGSPVRVYPFPVKQDEQEVLICEGEWDCLLARQLGFDAYSGTGGAGSIPPGLPKDCEGKAVIICYDADKAGREGASKLAECLIGRAKSIKILDLPVYAPNKDLSDWVLKYGADADALHALIDATECYESVVAQCNPTSFDCQTDVMYLTPKMSFVREYMNFCVTQTDAPPAFHLATALSIVSATIGNKAFLHSWGDAIYPNLWNLLIAPSGFYRKTTAMNLGVNLLRSVPGGLLPDEFTPERLFSHLAQHPAGLIAVSEFGALLTKMSKDYMSGIKEFLTNLYDCPKELTKELQPKTPDGPPRIITIHKPALSILGCSTLDWMFDRVKDGDLKGGFLARFLYWPVASKPDWMGLTACAQVQLRETLRGDLLDLMCVNGQMVLDPTAEGLYNEWNKQHEHEANGHKLPAMLQGFYTRLAVATLKIAMIYQISINGNLVISVNAMEFAIKTAEYLKRNLIHLLTEELVIGADQIDMKRIRDILTRCGGMTKAALLRASGLTLRRFETIIDTLVAAEYVRYEPVGGMYYAQQPND